MPVRKIPKNHVSVTGLHATSKSIEHAEFESPLENDYLTLLDFDPKVKDYEVQPVRVPVNGVPNGYVPDVLVHFHPNDGSPVPSELTEVKSESDYAINAEKYAPKFAAAEAFARERGWRFIKKSNVDIRSPALANLKFLRRYRWIDPGDLAKQLLLDELHRQGGRSSSTQLINALAKTEHAKAELLPILWHLVVTDQIEVDMNIAFGADVPLWALRGDK